MLLRYFRIGIISKGSVHSNIPYIEYLAESLASRLVLVRLWGLQRERSFYLLSKWNRRDLPKADSRICLSPYISLLAFALSTGQKHVLRRY